MRLLLIEDDPQTGPQLRRSLTDAGYAVDLAIDGIDGEALGDIEPYDLIVLDLGLPGRPGIDVLQNWRSHQNQTPVVILTARDDWQEKVAGFKAGADDYVGKPFQIEELLARIQAVLKRSKGLTNQPLQYGKLMLDEERQSATVDGKELVLTGTEFRLLRYLMMHPGVVLSKTRLTEHVYDYDSDKDSNVIEVYVNRLRQKIGNDLIQTRRGQGYVFGHGER